MYDGLLLKPNTMMVLNRCRLMPGAVELASVETGATCYQPFKYDVYNIYINSHGNGNKPTVKINGSLHRFLFGGKNDTLFSFRQVRKAVEKLAWEFCIDLQSPCLRKLEFGVNIPVKSPDAVIDAAVLYHGRGPTKTVRKKKEYYKYWEFTDYIVKLYRKGPALVRFEVHVSHLKWLKNKDIRIRGLEDLRNRDVFVKLLHRLLSCVDEFLFVPSRQEGKMPPEIWAEWASLRDVSYWYGLKPYTKTRKGQWVRETINDCHLVDWTAYFKKNIWQLGARMLETDETTLAAMFSTLGLLPETAAVCCGRQARTKRDVHTPIPFESIRIVLKVRNEGIGWILDVVRVYRDIHMGGRGPPVPITRRFFISANT